MKLLPTIAIGIVATLHVVFMLLESVLWTRPAGLRIFAQSAAQAETTRVLALNQGVYNGGVAVLLIWSLCAGQLATTKALLVFIIAMGIVGGVSVKPSIIALQSVPAAIALALLFWAR